MSARSASPPRTPALPVLAIVAALCAALLPASPASAQDPGDPDGFEEVVSFDDYEPGALAGQDGWETSGPVAVVTDPVDDANQVMRATDSGDRARRAVAGIADGATGTVFFRMLRHDTLDTNAGLSAAETPVDFGHFEVQANMQESPTLNVKTGSDFAAVGTVSEDVWQCVWMVADNASDTYEIYSLGGPYEQLTQLPAGDGGTYDFRNGTSGALDRFFVGNGNQSGGGAVHFDDVAMDTSGANLAVPGGGADDKCQAGAVDDTPLLNPLPDPTPSNLGLVLEEFVTLPETKPTSGNVTDGRLIRENRINHLSELPDGSGRMAVPDLNGPLYLLEDDGSYVEYLDLVDEFPDMRNHAGLGTGFGFVEFHPDFGQNGTFYTVHTEDGAALEKDTDFPEFGRTVTHSVITEWVADDPSADTFSGTSTEMMRIGFGGQIHTVQQIGFNPTAEEGDPDHGLLYLLVGDGGNGVDNDNPQDLSTPQGKIFRIDPDGTDGRTGEYGIPDDNPHLDDPDALPEIYARGMRDPHRMSWDPAAGNRMFLGHIGEWQVESVYEVQPGDNFGWSEREGPFRAEGRQLYPLPEDDAQYGYTYPVAAYDHDRDPGQTGDAGIALAGGFVYRGEIGLLQGRYIFTDLVRGYPYATRASQMQRGSELAEIEHLKLYVDGEETTFAELNADDDPNDGNDDRIDLRVGRDAEGELYLLSKGSGTIWRIVDAVLDLPHDNPIVTPSLTENLVAYYDFDHPAEDDATFEDDRGLSGTDIELVNGGTQMRVPDAAYPGAGNALQTQQVDPDAAGNDDWKAGIFDGDGVDSLGAFNATDAISVMGWFKPTGQNPSLNTNSSDPDDRYNAIGLAGVLSGDSDGHGVRALLEVIEVGGELKVVALGRRIDGSGSWIFAADEPWDQILVPGEWVHLAATFDFDAGEMRLFKNGEPLAGEYTSSSDPWGVGGEGPFYTSPTDPAGIKIGGSYPQDNREANPCNCRMDDLMFLDRVPSAEEIAAQYEAFGVEENTAPSVDDLALTTDQDTAVDGQVVAEDADGDPLTFAFDEPEHGTVEAGSDGAFTYTPDAGFVGTDTFAVTVTDDRGGEATATITVEVAEVEPPPARPVTKDDCKKGGWRQYEDPSFRNQGQCVAWVASGGRGGGAGRAMR